RATEADGLDGRELQIDLVRADAAAHRVVGMAVTAANHQIPGEGQVLQQRRPDLDEPLVYTYGGVERLLRAAGSGQLTAVGGVIRLVEHGLVAVLHAEVDAKPLTRRRQLEAVFAELARDIGMKGAQGIVTAGGSGQIQVVDLVRRHSALGKDIPRHAWLADQTLRIRLRAGYEQRVVDLLITEVIVLRVAIGHVVVLAVGAVHPGVQELALHTDRGAVVGVLVV